MICILLRYTEMVDLSDLVGCQESMKLLDLLLGNMYVAAFRTTDDSWGFVDPPGTSPTFDWAPQIGNVQCACTKCNTAACCMSTAKPMSHIQADFECVLWPPALKLPRTLRDKSLRSFPSPNKTPPLPSCVSSQQKPSARTHCWIFERFTETQRWKLGADIWLQWK